MVNIITITIPVWCMIVTGSMCIAMDWHFTEPNIAFGKNTTQSPGWSPAALAVDGNTNSDYNKGSCTHTSEDGDSAWWTVYLDGNYKITGIIIYNRNINKFRLKDFKVIGLSASNTNVTLYDDNVPRRYNDSIIPIGVDDAGLFTSITITVPSYPLTLCEVKIFAACRPPTALSNGTYSPLQDGYGFGSMITVTCDNDYILYGNIPMACQGNGLWNETEPKCIENKCYNNLDVRNGNYTYNGKAYLSEKRMLGDVVTVVCDLGYKHTLGSLQRTCTIYAASSSYGVYSAWNGTIPTCSLITCPRPITFSGGRYDPQLQNTDISNLPYGTVIHATCDNSLYKFTGEENRTCGEKSTWSGVEPSCVALCNEPNVTNGHYERNGSTTQYEQGQHINITCDVGYMTSAANSQITCDSDHLWNGGDVICNVIKSDTEEQQGGSAAAIGGSVAGVIVLIAIGGVLGIMIYRKRRTSISKDRVSKRNARRTPDEICTPNPDGVYVNIQEAESDKQPRESKPLPAPKPTYSNQVFQQSDHVYYGYLDTDKLPERAIKVEALSDIVFTGDAATETYRTQFDSFPFGMKEKCTEALKPLNKPKNRYRNLYAYDDTRVILTTDDDESELDYINANYIHGFGQTRAYVASQGATKENINDIWRMIWQLDSGKIVMLTNLREKGKDKCDQYWPTEGSIVYGKKTVTLRKTEKFSDFIIRTLGVRQKGSDERVVLQFHFTAWPDKSVPKYASSVVSFRNKVKYTASPGKGPIVVHCSAGIGRTGTFIAIDYLTEQAHAHGYVDVAGCVETLRRQRVNMVQTLDQYIFIHQSLVETLMLAKSAIPSSNFTEAYKELLEIDPEKRKRKLNVQFELLKKMSPVAEEHQYASAKVVKNRNKNRYTNILPVDEFMPHLKPKATGSKGNYINAVFLPSYKEKRAFIITQTPLESTKEDFWRLECDHEVHTIVMMDDITELKEAEIYWPEEETGLKFGDINVKHIANEEFDSYRSLSLKVKRVKQTRNIKLIQCKQWTAGAALPDEPSCILSLMEVVQSWQQGTGNHPVVVHCMNGADKSGLFCVISAVIERMKIERDVAISQVIEEMRNSREQIITSVEQFQFCHKAVCTFMEQFATYSNFSA